MAAIVFRVLFFLAVLLIGLLTLSYEVYRTNQAVRGLEAKREKLRLQEVEENR